MDLKNFFSYSSTLRSPTCSFNLLTRIISKRESALVVSGDFLRLFKSCCFSPPGSCCPFVIFCSAFLEHSSDYCSIFPVFLFTHLLSESTAFSPVHGMPLLWYRCQEGGGTRLLRAAVWLGPWQCSQPNQSRPQSQLFEKGIGDMKLLAGIFSLVFSCFNLTTYL